MDLSGTAAAVRAAQISWAAIPLEARCDLIRRVGRRFASRAEEVARVVCEETRKHAVDAWFADVVPNLDLFEHWTGKGLDAIKESKAPMSPVKFPGKTGVLSYEPRGLIGLITPWNYPSAIPLRTLVPALVAGNAVLFKPSEVTPRTGELLGEIFGELLPGGVLTVVQGGAEAGRAVIDESDHVVFTGSVATGREVAVRCAEQLKTCSLELGGKDAAIVLRDCDLDRTVQGVFWGAMANSGQNCASIERVYVDRSIYQGFVQRLTDLADRLRDQVAPVATEAQDAIVRRHLEDARERGATLHGEYPGPVILTEVPRDARVMTEETFGPLCPVAPFDRWEEAVARVNRSPFGLTTSVWTSDEPRARSIARKVRTGVVTVNNVALTASMPFAPWTGRGDSGHGVTNSHLAMLELVQPKFVLVDKSRGPEAWWFPFSEGAVQLARTSLGWLNARGLDRLSRTLGVVGGLRRRGREQKDKLS